MICMLNVVESKNGKSFSIHNDTIHSQLLCLMSQGPEFEIVYHSIKCGILKGCIFVCPIGLTYILCSIGIISFTNWVLFATISFWTIQLENVWWVRFDASKWAKCMNGKLCILFNMINRSCAKCKPWRWSIKSLCCTLTIAN